jgi:ribosomal protein L3 glutamine methyltransferase
LNECVNIGDDISLSEAVERVSVELAASGVFFGHGTFNADDEAAWLVLAACGIPVDADTIPWNQQIDQQQASAVKRLLERRIQSRKPLAYLLEEAWFAGYSFHVDERVLVPRSHLTEWIPDRFAPWIQPESVRDVLDLCCGSGCIGIATALVLPECQVLLSDISRDALDVAQINIHRHELQDRVAVHHADGLSGLQQRFDLILCNPPYVSSGAMATLPPEYQAEPALGLESGLDGIDFIRALLSSVTHNLKPGGTLIVEAGSAGETVMAEWPDVPFTWLGTDSDEPVLFLLTYESLVASGF